jgi:tyrosyl-tRNA synthetase
MIELETQRSKLLNNPDDYFFEKTSSLGSKQKEAMLKLCKNEYTKKGFKIYGDHYDGFGGKDLEFVLNKNWASNDEIFRFIEEQEKMKVRGHRLVNE